MFHYIPVEDTLKALLKSQDVTYEIDAFHGSNDEVLRDLCDGSVFKNHSILSKYAIMDKNALQIITYFDKIELCNPLGSKRKHKLGCMFFFGKFKAQISIQIKQYFCCLCC